MPRAKAVKPSTAATPVVDEAQVMYGEYVHGVPVAQIAAKRNMEPQEVLTIITTVEQNRHK